MENNKEALKKKNFFIKTDREQVMKTVRQLLNKESECTDVDDTAEYTNVNKVEEDRVIILDDEKPNILKQTTQQQENEDFVLIDSSSPAEPSVALLDVDSQLDPDLQRILQEMRDNHNPDTKRLRLNCHTDRKLEVGFKFFLGPSVDYPSHSYTLYNVPSNQTIRETIQSLVKKASTLRGKRKLTLPDPLLLTTDHGTTTVFMGATVGSVAGSQSSVLIEGRRFIIVDSAESVPDLKKTDTESYSLPKVDRDVPRKEDEEEESREGIEIKLRFKNQRDTVQVFVPDKTVSILSVLTRRLNEMDSNCINKDMCKFLFDGERMGPSDTIASLGMEDGDIVDVL